MYKSNAGDWDCSSCGRTKIFARRDVCQGCGAQKPKPTPVVVPVTVPAPALVEEKEEKKEKKKSKKLSSTDKFIDGLDWGNHSEEVRNEISGKISQYYRTLEINTYPVRTIGHVPTCSLCGAKNPSRKCPHDSWKYDCDCLVCTDCVKRYHTCGSCIQSASVDRHVTHVQRARYCRDHDIPLSVKIHKGCLRVVKKSST